MSPGLIYPAKSRHPNRAWLEPSRPEFLGTSVARLEEIVGPFLGLSDGLPIDDCLRTAAHCLRAEAHLGA